MPEENKHYIHLSFNNQAEGFRIPVNPESLEVQQSGNGKTYDIVGKGGGTDETRAGMVNVIKNPGLKEISFSSIFPATYYPFVVSEKLFEPMYYIKLIEKWWATKHPIRFIYTGFHRSFVAERGGEPEGDINIPASIERFSWKEVGGAPGDIEYTLTLKEYVFYSARQSVVRTDQDGNKLPSKRYDERIRPDTYTIKKAGESLIDVSMRWFEKNGGPDSSRHMDIQKLNGLTDSQVKKGLAVGTVLKLPPY
jgi:hypothetical protein